MAKFKVHMEIAAFKLEVEAEREEDMTHIAQHIQQGLSGMLNPVMGLTGSAPAVPHKPHQMIELPPDTVDEPARGSKRKRAPRSARPSSPSASNAADEKILQMSNVDAQKWGFPRQDWNTANKALWLLYVAGQEFNNKELTGRQIAATFNHHFKQAGVIHPPNVTRDLGRMRASSKEVGENTGRSPSGYYLLHSGEERAKELVTQARAPTGTQGKKGKP